MPQTEQLFQTWKLHNSVTHHDIQYSISWHATLAYMKALGKKNMQKGKDMLLAFLC